MVSQEIEGAEICRIATVELVLLFDATSSCTTSPVSMTQVGRTKMSASHTRIRSMYISVPRVGQSRLLESHILTMDVVQNKVVFYMRTVSYFGQAWNVTDWRERYVHYIIHELTRALIVWPHKVACGVL